VKNRVAELLQQFPTNEAEVKKALRDTQNMKPELTSEVAQKLLNRDKMLEKFAKRVDNVSYEE